MSKMFACNEECPSLRETIKRDVCVYYQRYVGHATYRRTYCLIQFGCVLRDQKKSLLSEISEIS